MPPESFDVITVGAVLIDMIAMVDEFPKKDGESFVQEFKMMPGGAAANVAVICSRLGLKTAFTGKIGRDDLGKFLESDLTNEKVHIQQSLVYSDTVSTGSCYICVNKEGERMILAYSGAADTLQIDELPIDLIKKAKWFHLSDLRNVGAIEALLEEYGEEVRFSLSPGALIAQNPSRAYRLAQHAKLIVASKDEVTQIFRCSEQEIDQIAEDFIKEREESIIAVTKGKEGVSLYSSEGSFPLPAFDVDVVDTTGAGDAFAAGMLYALTKGARTEEAGRIASACSAVCIQNIGARSGPKNRKEVIKFLRQRN
jgi:ribokinase